MANARQKLRCDDLSHVLEEQAGTAGWTKCLGLDSVSTPRWIMSAYLAYERTWSPGTQFLQKLPIFWLMVFPAPDNPVLLVFKMCVSQVRQR